MSGGAVSWVTTTWVAICWSFSGNGISSVTFGIPGSVSSFSEEYTVYVYFKSYIDLYLFLNILISRIKKIVLNKFSNRFCHYFLLITTCRTQINIAQLWLSVVSQDEHVCICAVLAKHGHVVDEV
jgi:predicted phosphoadenosine phosphosulfate sulfurtransferase